jgi:enoyl-CoA hydratase/carnithine racemase
MSYETILLARDQGLATLTLNAPDKLNAVSRRMIAELKDCWEALAGDASVRAVLLTGGPISAIPIAARRAAIRGPPSTSSSIP